MPAKIKYGQTNGNIAGAGYSSISAGTKSNTEEIRLSRKKKIALRWLRANIFQATWSTAEMSASSRGNSAIGKVLGCK